MIRVMIINDDHDDDYDDDNNNVIDAEGRDSGNHEDIGFLLFWYIAIIIINYELYENVK